MPSRGPGGSTRWPGITRRRPAPGSQGSMPGFTRSISSEPRLNRRAISKSVSSNTVTTRSSRPSSVTSPAGSSNTVALAAAANAQAASHGSRFTESGSRRRRDEDLLPADFLTIAAALFHELQSAGVDRQRVGFLVDDNFALQGTVKLRGHGSGLTNNRVRWPDSVSQPLRRQYALAAPGESP